MGCDVSCGFVIFSLCYVEVCLSIPILLRDFFFYHKWGLDFCQMFFLHLLKLSHSSVNVVCFIDWFPDVESFFHHWNNLIMVNSVFFWCIAEPNLLILCWGFFIYVHQIYWPVILLLLLLSLSGFGIRVTLAL